MTLKLLKTPFPRGETEGKEQQKGSTLIIEEFSARPSLLGNSKETGKTQRKRERDRERKKTGCRPETFSWVTGLQQKHTIWMREWVREWGRKMN